MVWFGLVWFVTGSSATAQNCLALGDDGFRATNVCCTPATLSIPPFPVFKGIPGSYFCVHNCATTTDFDVSIVVGVPSPFSGGPCDKFGGSVTVNPVAPGAPTISIPLTLKYSRTWIVRDSFGRDRQVWRFLANGEAFYLGTGATPCPRPMCTLHPYNPWFNGFIDYASPPSPSSPGPAQGCAVRVLLGHKAGCLSHYDNPTYNAQALSATDPNRHDDYAFFIVTPVPFNPATTALSLPPTSWIDVPVGTADDALRTNRTALPATAACLEEAPLTSVVATTTIPTCFCAQNAMGAKPLNYIQSLQGQIFCNTTLTFMAIPNVPGLPQTGFEQEYVGQWAVGAGLWPFKTHAWLSSGFFSYSDIGCGFPSLQPDFHFMWGGSTVFPPDDLPPFITLFGGSVGVNLMTDLVNSLVLDLPGGAQTPMVGTTVSSALLFQVSR